MKQWITTLKQRSASLCPGHAALVIFLTLVQFRILVFIYRNGVGVLARVADDITHGKAWWQAFQNKLLGPYLLSFITAAANVSLTDGYYIFMLALLLLANTVFFYLLFNLTCDRKRSLGYTACFIALTLAFMDPSWLYTWDLIGLLLFSVFAFLVFKRAPLPAYLLLFIPALLNREDALFIPLWLMIDSFEYAPRIRLKDAGQFLLGAAVTGFGIYYTWYIRQACWINNGQSTGVTLLGSHLQLVDNLKALFLTNPLNLNCVVTIFMFLLAYYFYRHRAALRGYLLKAALLFIALFLFNLIFGLVNETRTWLILIPFLLYFDLAFRGAFTKP